VTISKPLYGLLLALVVAGVVLLARRTYASINREGEREQPWPALGVFGLILSSVAALILGLSLSPIPRRVFFFLFNKILARPYDLLEQVLNRFQGLRGGSPSWLTVLMLVLGIILVFAGIACLIGGWLRSGERRDVRRLALQIAGVLLVLAGFSPLIAFIVTELVKLSAHPVAKGVEAGIIALGIGIFFLARLSPVKGFYRALFWGLGTVTGVAFGVLATITARMPTGKGVPFRVIDQAIRVSALVTSVFFVLSVLAALLPIILDRLEGRGFTPFVGARHVRATKSGFLTVISVLSMAGVAVSSCSLCSVTSIMGGFGADLKRKILGNNAHIVVDVTRPGGFGDWETKLDGVRLALAPQGGAATPVVAGDAMASSASNTAGALVRGIDLNTIAQVIDLKDNIEVGRFEYLEDPSKLTALPPDEKIGIGPGGEPYYKGPEFKWSPDADPTVRDYLKQQVKIYPGVIIGRELAKSLHVLVGDEITLLSPIGELGPTGVMPRTRRFRVAGIFYSGMYEYDATHAYVKLDVAQSFFSLEDRITNIDIRVPDPERVTDLRPAVDRAVGGMEADAAVKDAELRVRDWVEMNRNLFSALKLEKVATFIILSIAIAVASFCIICTLLLMVTEKGKEIAVLKALGASDGAIMRIFMIEGVIIGGIGTIFGVVTALAVCTGLLWFGADLPPEVYYIDRLPVTVNGFDYAMVAVAAFIICTIATIYPAHAASKLTPVDGLRYE
jgi:lipoprotein-releasing system permease protein